jgi:transposase-like protein
MEAERLLRITLDAWRKEHPKLAQWAEEAIPESLTIFAFSASQRVRLRTTNGLERINRELRRRTRLREHLLQSRVVPARLVSACPTRRRVRPQGLSQPQHVTPAS